MKRIEAIIRPEKLQDVFKALNEIDIRGITATDVHGHGIQKGHNERFRGGEYEVFLVPKVMLILYVADSALDLVIDTVSRTALTGMIGDGKIAVSELTDLRRIRTGESGDEAL
jgi:nitrogen regulatory protein PII